MSGDGKKHGLPMNIDDVGGIDDEMMMEDVGGEADSKRRRKLWRIDSAFSCSLVGTCLSSEDVAWLMRRLQIPQLNGASEYDVHRFLVRESTRSGVASRLMHKRLEAKYSGMIKRFSRENDPAALTALWESALAEGKVAAAYWALATHPNIDDALKARAFGDVHMLSHINGGENRKLMQSYSQLSRQFSELERRLARSERADADRLKQRDARIRELEDEVRRLRGRVDTAPAKPPAPAPPDSRIVRRLEKSIEEFRRRASVERWRARKAEEEARRLRRQAGDDGDLAIAAAPEQTPPPIAQDDISGKSILYVGGRPHVLRHLKASVEARRACLLHHDGGMEQTTRSLEGLVERADIVVCPIDCVSHDACLRIKSMCKQRCKPFLPLRNAGASSFRRALNIEGEATANLSYRSARSGLNSTGTQA